jgi:hypothetical protein
MAAYLGEDVVDEEDARRGADRRHLNLFIR